MSHLLTVLSMVLMASEIASRPIPADSWVGCAAVFLTVAILDWFARRNPSGSLPKASLWLGRFAWVLLTAMLSYQGLNRHALPIATPAEVLLTIAWGLTGLVVLLDLTFDHRLPIWSTNGTAAICLGLAGFLGVAATPLDTAGKPLILMHIGAAVLAYCLLVAQALNSGAYLLQDRALARRKFGGIYALLPSLVPMDRIGRQLLGAAVWMLGLSLVIGATDWAQRDLAVALPKLAASLVTWLACVYVLVQRRRHHLLGAEFARASLLIAFPAALALFLSLPLAR